MPSRFSNLDPTRRGRIVLEDLDAVADMASTAGQPFIDGPGFFSSHGVCIGLTTAVGEGSASGTVTPQGAIPQYALPNGTVVLLDLAPPDSNTSWDPVLRAVYADVGSPGVPPTSTIVSLVHHQGADRYKILNIGNGPIFLTNGNPNPDNFGFVLVSAGDVVTASVVPPFVVNPGEAVELVWYPEEISTSNDQVLSDWSNGFVGISTELTGWRLASAVKQHSIAISDPQGVLQNIDLTGLMQLVLSAYGLSAAPIAPLFPGDIRWYAIALADASGSREGIVNTRSGQQFAGDKQFLGNLSAKSFSQSPPALLNGGPTIAGSRTDGTALNALLQLLQTMGILINSSTP